MTSKPKVENLSHLNTLLAFDAKLISKLPLLPALRSKTFQPPSAVIGIDEVGRGCLAGPVVAAAVQLPPLDFHSSSRQELRKLNDSKKLTAHERERLAHVIMSISIYSIAEASVEEIDKLNILQASLLAMKRAREGMKDMLPSLVIVDGNKTIPGLADPQVPVVKGDSLSASIAAASIIAKVHRDQVMSKLSLFFPNYHWHKNKGYASLEHRQAIAEHGLTELHRRTFNCHHWQT